MRAGLTPTRLLLVVVAIGAGVVALYGLAIAKSIPMTVSGLAVLGIALFALGVLLAVAAVRAGQRGAAGTAFAAAIFGGLCMLAASGTLGVAIILGLLAAST